MTLYQQLREARIPLHQKRWINGIYENILVKISNSNLSVGDIAYDFSMSERQFQRRIRSISGLSPIEFIRAIKLDYAKALLESGNYQTVQETAYAVGFKRSDYFTNLFKNRFGIKPISYLKNHNKPRLAES